jgi:23S rRNA (guanosine2251-2'-O)-methyltransferase
MSQKTKSQANLIIGRKPLLEAIQNGKAVDKIYYQTNVSGELLGDINRLAKEYNIPIQRVPVQKLDGMTRVNHQGVIGIGAVVDYYRLQDVIDDLFSKGINPQLMWLDSITDVRNMGAIARTAKCFGIDAIIVTEKGNGAINDEAVKTSAGAILDYTIVREKHTIAVLEILQANGFKIFASSLEAVKKMSSLNFTEPCVVVMGSEENGVTEQVIKACTDTFIIPMSKNFDSLNVSVAAGIIGYEMFTQRG